MSNWPKYYDINVYHIQHAILNLSPPRHTKRLENRIAYNERLCKSHNLTQLLWMAN
jgi:hypothetical protein